MVAEVLVAIATIADFLKPSLWVVPRKEDSELKQVLDICLMEAAR